MWELDFKHSNRLQAAGCKGECKDVWRSKDSELIYPHPSKYLSSEFNARRRVEMDLRCRQWNLNKLLDGPGSTATEDGILGGVISHLDRSSWNLCMHGLRILRIQGSCMSEFLDWSFGHEFWKNLRMQGFQSSGIQGSCMSEFST